MVTVRIKSIQAEHRINEYKSERIIVKSKILFKCEFRLTQKISKYKMNADNIKSIPIGY